MSMVQMGRDGRSVLVDDDVLDIARRIKEIDDSLLLRWNERGEFFVVAQIVQTPDGPEEKLVLTTMELDERIIHRLKHISHASYNLADEAEKIDREADRKAEHEFSERVGEIGEHAAHALRKDLQAQSKIIIP